MTEEEKEDWKRMFENAETIYLSQEDFDAIMNAINRPPKVIPSIQKLLQRKAPWETSHENNTDSFSQQ